MWPCSHSHQTPEMVNPSTSPPHPPLPPRPSKCTKLSTAPQALLQRRAVMVTRPVYDSHITYVSCLWGHQQTRLTFCERKCFGGVRVEVRQYAASPWSTDNGVMTYPPCVLMSH